MEEAMLRREEKAVFALRTLYRKYGYLPFRMSKFEEYDLYQQNKDFLVSDSVITFNDTSGKLMALKPDVTLSIIKNCKVQPGCTQKVYYNESVYRLSGSTHAFKEIMQSGLECIGDIELYNISEVVTLAAQSLSLISEDFVLDISHMGILSAMLCQASQNPEFIKKATRCIDEKNAHGVKALCLEYAVAADEAEKLAAFVGVYGDMEKVLKQLKPLCVTRAAEESYAELNALYEILAKSPFANRMRFDFSIVNNMSYYNGILFKGFLNGIPESILSGGQYDLLMERMNRNCRAIGFAVYLDLLELTGDSETKYDVDTLLLYDGSVCVTKLTEAVEMLTGNGKSVSVQKAIPEKLRYRQLLRLHEGGLEIVEANG